MASNVVVGIASAIAALIAIFAIISVIVVCFCCYKNRISKNVEGTPNGNDKPQLLTPTPDPIPENTVPLTPATNGDDPSTSAGKPSGGNLTPPHVGGPGKLGDGNLTPPHVGGGPGKLGDGNLTPPHGGGAPITEYRKIRLPQIKMEDYGKRLQTERYITDLGAAETVEVTMSVKDFEYFKKELLALRDTFLPMVKLGLRNANTSCKEFAITPLTIDVDQDFPYTQNFWNVNGLNDICTAFEQGGTSTSEPEAAALAGEGHADMWRYLFVPLRQMIECELHFPNLTIKQHLRKFTANVRGREDLVGDFFTHVGIGQNLPSKLYGEKRDIERRFDAFFEAFYRVYEVDSKEADYLPSELISASVALWQDVMTIIRKSKSTADLGEDGYKWATEKDGFPLDSYLHEGITYDDMTDGLDSTESSSVGQPLHSKE